MGLGIRKINAHYCSLAASPKPKAANGKRSKLGSNENKFKFKIYKSAAGVAAMARALPLPQRMWTTQHLVVCPKAENRFRARLPFCLGFSAILGELLKVRRRIRK